MSQRISRDELLDALRACVVRVGVRRTTFAEVARLAGVSRMTLYRNFGDVRSAVAELMTREFSSLLAAADAEVADRPTARERLVDGAALVAERLADHDLFRESVAEFLKRDVVPFHDQWEKDGIVPREVWVKAGGVGLLGHGVPEEYGGTGLNDYRYNTIVNEELCRAHGSGLGFTLQNDVMAPYMVGLTNDEQKKRWLPGFASGELITAIAMTEPGTGSDLQGIKTSAVRDGDEFVINGSKTFITNGINADLVIVV
jgi:alkylation response protein AidB-like acyl-CoA dehydrogenase